MSEPRTAAGRALLERIAWYHTAASTYAERLKIILAIEAEAATGTTCPRCGFSGEHTATLSGPSMTTETHSVAAAVASEGLRHKQLVEIIEQAFFEDGVALTSAILAADRIIASDAGSVGALPLASAEVNGLDVERLARALQLELNRPHRAGHYDELAAAILAAYDAEGER